MSEIKIQKMIDEIKDVAALYSGENARVAILMRNDVRYIQITIPGKTLLDIEFHKISPSGSLPHD